MPTSTRKNGITLIALIITIIVMLILVGVTINVALNGGVFEKAKNASTQTQREADKEELLSAVFGTADNSGNLNVASLTINGWTKSAAKQDTDGKTYYEFTSAKENVFYVYAETGKVLDTEPAQNSNTEPVSRQVAGISVGNILKYNNEDWLVLYNDDTYGFQIARKTGIKYEGSNIEGKSGYNNVVEILNSQCQKFLHTEYNESNPIITGAIAARCGGSDPSFAQASNSYYVDNEHDLITAEDEVKVAANDNDENRNIDEGVFNTIMQSGTMFNLAENSNTMIIAARYITYEYKGNENWYFNADIPKIIFTSMPPVMSSIRLYYKNNSSEGTETITTTDNYTIFPIVKLRTDNGFTVTETETAGTFTYSYEE